MKKKVMMAVLLAGCLASSVVFAQGTKAASFEEQAGVSAPMAAKVKVLRDESQAKQRALKAQIEALSVEMKKEFEADKPNRKKMENIIATISARRNEQLHNTMALVLKLREIMTPEQYKKAEELRRASREKKAAQKKNREPVADKK